MEVATRFDGLRKHPTFGELINYIQEDPDVIQYPNRWATWANDSPFLSQFKDNWLDETFPSQGANKTHLEWLLQKKPGEVYDQTTQTGARYGGQGPSGLSVAAIQDLASQALAATAVVRTSEPAIVSEIPGVQVPDAGIAVVQELGTQAPEGSRGSGLLSALGIGVHKPAKPGPVHLYPGDYKVEEVEPPRPRSSSRGKSPIRGLLGAVGQGVGAVAQGVGAVAQAATGVLVGTAYAADALLTNVVDPMVDSVKERYKQEMRATWNDLQGLGPAGERAPVHGFFLPEQVLNGENPGQPRLALMPPDPHGSSSSSSGTLARTYGSAGRSGGLAPTSTGYPSGPSPAFGPARRSGRSGGSRNRLATP